jgi:AraC-like DNA-binding protein
MSLDMIEVLAVVTALQLILLSIFITSHKKSRKPSNKILAAFLFFSALPIIEYILWRFRDDINPHFPHVFYIGSLFVFLWGPLIYLYTKSLIISGFTFKRRDLLHFVPFLIFVLYMIFDFHIKSTGFKRELMAGYGALGIREKRIIYGFLHLQILSYLLLSLRILKSYRNEIKNLHSAIERIKLTWMNFILLGFICMWSVDLAYFILWGTKYSYLGEVLDYISLSITFVFACIIVYKGLNYPEILTAEVLTSPNKKYEGSSLSDTDKERFLKKLLLYMEEEKPYLEPLISLDTLARGVGISSRELSQIINECLGQNFFDFINRYRVEESKHVLSDLSADKKTILEILFDVGFNSKATFNRAFKKQEGLSPSKFRKLHRSKFASS